MCSAQGLGCMGMSSSYLDKEGKGAAEAESIAVIHRCVIIPVRRHVAVAIHDPRKLLILLRRAKELGITFLDTSDAYGPHTNEVKHASCWNSCSAHLANLFGALPLHAEQSMSTV